MIQRKQNRSDRSALKQRREQVLEHLAAYGFMRGPHRIVRAGNRWNDAQSPGLKLRTALSELGPIFSSFGRYLATRVDLLPAADCLELEAIADNASPMSLTEVWALIEREIGATPEEAFLILESEPFASRLLYQLHRATLRENARPVVVKLVRPEVTPQLLCDLEVLELIAPVIEGPKRSAIYKTAVADFALALRQRIDLTHEAKLLETLRRDAQDFELLRVPEVMPELSGTSLLTVEHLPGEIISGDQRGIVDRQTVARLFCSAWLRQALLGHVFPVEPCPANLAVISDRQVAFTGGVFSSLPAESQSNFWNYLIASAGDSPDQACSYFLKEMRHEGASGNNEDLRHRFRQVVPFRDSGWYSDDDKNRLIQHLVVHWQSATECGYVPSPRMTSFCRGLFAIARVAQLLSPETDALLEGLQEARLLESTARLREMLSFQHLGDQVDRYAAMMMAMPQRLDQMLTLGSEGGTRLKLHVPESVLHRRQKNSVAVMAAMLLLLNAVAFALPRLTSVFVGNIWAGRMNAIAFIACGALLLLATSRTR
ncbi:MAG TPA: AarF/UbiB family protein [Pyrinomonadaceae bacterium]|nr:AarF/UbiB family protein [Pyrinomonadaceae bacterium]